ncbi:Transposon Tf2-6 polyprotein [Labeo rohita]|uniref:Gypsy retrotransposon integrase-like protein 1 n=1 Tax=Labeo rohita TaxID=84645 RepID=A0ABQ8L5U2_LABRO|nr:Transposon Tf2-6 polyprotein [Labeo rohita]
MALYDDSVGLEAFLQQITHVSQRLATCQPPVTAPQSASVAALSPVPEPMQIDSSCLTRAERNRRLTLGLCLYCGQQGHLLCNCPVRPPHPAVSTITSDVKPAQLTLLPVVLHTAERSLSVSALEYGVQTVQGKPLGRGRIRHTSPFITLQVGLFHEERIRFLVLEDSTVSIILGRPWLQQHLPELSWDPCDITRWNDSCYQQCLTNLPRPSTTSIQLSSTQVESPEPEVVPVIPAEYRVFQDFFSAKRQPLFHHTGHGTVPLNCCLVHNYQVMEEYIAEALEQGFIQPSTSPAASSCFFVGKKDGGLRPCIDYRQLNCQIIQQPYPLPLVRAALEELRGAHVFTKLDLRSAYNLVRIRLLSPAEQNYDIGNRELLAIKLALEEWRHWLEGARHPFTIITDHKNLQYLREARRLNPRQARWALFLTRFNFAITYRPGSKNIPADALSRMFSPEAPTEPEAIIPPNLILSPIVWDLDREIQQATLQEPAPPECPEGKIYISRSQRQSLLGTAHDSLGSGHPGSSRTLSFLQSRYWWPSKLVHLPIPQRPWSHLGIDFITDLPISEGNTCVLVATNGQTERKIQELGHYLRAYCQDDQHSWSRFLPWAKYAQNSLHQDSTGLTPFQCILGYQPLLFPWTEEPSNVPAVDHWFRESERVWDSAHHHLQRAVRRYKIFADARRRAAPIYQPGDLVWLSTRDVRLRLPCRKLSPRYIGPFRILRQINEVTFQLQLPPRYRIYPTFHISLLKPVSPPVTDPPGAEAEPPPPEVLDQPSIYSVHEILDSQRRGGRLEYLVDWEGHPDRPAPRSRGQPRRRVRASGAAPGGGGNVRRSPQPPPSDMSPTAPPTHSTSPEF